MGTSCGGFVRREMGGISQGWGFEGFLDALRCVSLARVWERRPCMHVSHMQMDFEMLCVLSVFRKGTIWRKNPPGNVDFCRHGAPGSGLGGREGWE